MENIGVIIQGPLVTYGQGPNNSIDGFNSFETILLNCENINRYSFSYVVSTWHSISLIEIDIIENLRKSNINICLIETPSIFDPDHRYKHRYGILKGAEHLLLKCHIDFFVKIRTDMLMPDKFWEWLLQISTSKSNCLFVSHLFKRPFYIGDFIYAANSEVFLNFIQLIVNYKSTVIHPSIAFDDGIKYFQEKKTQIFPKCRFNLYYLVYIFVFRFNKLFDLWDEFIKEYIEVIPQNVWVIIEWRGKKIGDIITNTHHFHFNNNKLLLTPSHFVLLMEIIDDYRRYNKKADKNDFVLKVIYVNLYLFQRFSLKLRKNRILFFLFTKKIILGRIACLGSDIIKMRYADRNNFELINIQKGRADIILDMVNGSPRPKTNIIKEYLLRKDIFSLIKQQETFEWLNYRKIQLIVLDSFSDLTDQKFTHKNEGWSFCAHYSDININEQFKDKFNCEGLLKINLIESVYRNFFSYIESKYPGIKIIFIHYSPKFDNRDEYHQRCNEIQIVMDKFELEKTYIKNLYLDDEKIKKNENDDFPWHYGQSTIKEFVKEWEEKDEDYQP